MSYEVGSGPYSPRCAALEQIHRGEMRLPSQAARLMRGVDIERLKTAKTFPGRLTEAVRGSMYFPVLSATGSTPRPVCRMSPPRRFSCPRTSTTRWTGS